MFNCTPYYKVLGTQEAAFWAFHWFCQWHSCSAEFRTWERVTPTPTPSPIQMS